MSAPVKKGDALFKLDSSKQEATAESARRKIAEVDADMNVARIDVLKSRRSDRGSQEQPSADHR